MTKDKFPILVYVVQNDDGYSIFLDVKTDSRKYSDMDSGYYTDYSVAKIPYARKSPRFWMSILEESMKNVCFYYLMAYYRAINKEVDDFYATRDAEVLENMKQFSSDMFESDKWETVG